MESVEAGASERRDVSENAGTGTEQQQRPFLSVKCFSDLILYFKERLEPQLSHKISPALKRNS